MVTTLMTGVPARDAFVNTVQSISGRVTPPGTAAVTTYNVKIGTLPAGAVILTVTTDIETVLGAGTPTLNVGTTSGGAEIVAAVPAAANSVNSVPIAALVMPLAADTDIWANILAGTAPLTGNAYVIVSFIKPAA